MMKKSKNKKENNVSAEKEKIKKDKLPADYYNYIDKPGGYASDVNDKLKNL